MPKRVLLYCWPAHIMLVNSGAQLPQQLQAQLITKKSIYTMSKHIKLLHNISLVNELTRLCNARFCVEPSFCLAGEQSVQSKNLSKTYARKGADVVAQNIAAVDSALAAIEEVNLPDQVTSTIPMSTD